MLKKLNHNHSLKKLETCSLIFFYSLKAVKLGTYQGYYIQDGLKMTSGLAGLVFAIQKGSFKDRLICLR